MVSVYDGRCAVDIYNNSGYSRIIERDFSIASQSEITVADIFDNLEEIFVPGVPIFYDDAAVIFSNIKAVNVYDGTDMTTPIQTVSNSQNNVSISHYNSQFIMQQGDSIFIDSPTIVNLVKDAIPQAERESMTYIADPSSSTEYVVLRITKRNDSETNQHDLLPLNYEGITIRIGPDISVRMYDGNSDVLLVSTELPVLD